MTGKSTTNALTMPHILLTKLRDKDGAWYRVAVTIGIARVVGNKEREKNMGVLWPERVSLQKRVLYFFSQLRVEDWR